ncbi:putative mitochondrial protein [Cardamine amara subsp. amara]|uniref:Mitochondrial protein n=1 Tax=Cardamine amara subsp. amara TaxID=228776 RepID=A0ABD1B026_CARAN
MNLQLTKEVTTEEKQKAATYINGDRAPGPDGITGHFYHQFWPIIGDDIITEVRDFFRMGLMPSQLNHNNICLLTKIDKPEKMSDYHPISLCNTSYKIISKILMTRLKYILSEIISPEQTCFVPGRQITDNVMVAHELLHSLNHYHRQSKSYMAMKTDIRKTYDRVEWNFLEKAMEQLKFNQKWITWIMACVRTVSFSIVINGSPYGEIRPTRGMRQGDPISPYLFLFCAEMLTQRLRQEELKCSIKGLSISNFGPRVTHLIFADDSLFFCQANAKNCKALALVLQ